MNVVVCVKQVPASSDVKVDPVSGVLIRDGNNSKMNPYDLFAVETATFIKESREDVNIKAISMGPTPAIAVLNEAIWMGCDEGILISDRKFGGADVVATAYTLSQGITSLGKTDLIICGKQTTDGDTAQVGPEIAEYLSIPHIAYVDKILQINDDHIIVGYSMDSTQEIRRVNFPCLITVEKNIFTPRLPSYKRKLEFEKKEIKVITFNDLEDNDESHYGLKGSPTQVEKMFSPSKNNDKTLFEGTNEEVANQLFEKLIERKLI